jgi:hypothetical protein
MTRRTAAALLLAALGGLTVTQTGAAGPFMNQWRQQQGSNPGGIEGASCGVRSVPTAPGMVGPYGQPVPVMAPPASDMPTTGQVMAQQTILRQLPPEVAAEVIQKSGQGAMMPPGYYGGPGGVVPAGIAGPPGGPPIAGVVAAPPPSAGPAPFASFRTEIKFVGPSGMKISWFAPQAGGRTGFGPEELTAPARYNFPQAAVYRLKLADIPNRPDMVLYPTLEVVPANARTATFLAHSAVPVFFSDEDLDQVAAGNFLVKVIYLPDPQFQELATLGVDEVVSTRLEPGVDPIAEACRRGSILAVVRVGNINLELPNSPSMDVPPGWAPGHLPPGLAPGLPPGAAGPFAPMGNPKVPAAMPQMPLPPGQIPQM